MSFRKKLRRQTFGEALAAPMSAFWAGGDGPTASVTESAVGMAGLEWIGTNKQNRVLNALRQADDESAAEAARELVRVLRDQGIFTRAQRDESVRTNVARLRRTLGAHGMILTDSGELEDSPPEDDGLDPWNEDDEDNVVEESDADYQATGIRPARVLRVEPASRPLPHREAKPIVSVYKPVPKTSSPDPRRVFLVHGRDHRIRNSMVKLIAAFDLRVLEWEEAAKFTGKPSPTTMEIVSAGMEAAAAIVVLFTPDDEGRCREQFQSGHDGRHETEYTPQARMNVIFEAGMAMYKDPGKTLLVRFGSVREMSDIAGVNYIQIKDDVESRRAVGNRLALAGAAVDMTRDDWRDAGDFTQHPAAVPHSSTPSSSGPTVQPEPPPMGLADTAIAYLSAPESTRQYEALVRKSARALRMEINTLPLSCTDDQPLEPLEDRYQKLFELSAPLLHVLKASLDLGIDGVKKSTWSDALQNLVDARNKVRVPEGTVLWKAAEPRYEQARHLPALLALRVAGLTALSCNDTAAALWIDMCHNVTWRSPELGKLGDYPPRETALAILDEYEVLDEKSVMSFAVLQDESTATTALGRYLRRLLRPLFLEECPTEDDWEDLNDQFEYRRAMLYVRENMDVPPVLAATGIGRWTSGGWKPEADFLSAVESASDDWPWWSVVGDPSDLQHRVADVRVQLGQHYH